MGGIAALLSGKVAAPTPSLSPVAGLLAGQPPAEDFAPVLSAVAKAYPRLAPYVAQTAVSRGKTEDDRQLEFYAPDEADNPTPGKLHVQMFNDDLKGDDLRDSVALDMLHHVGSIDPKTGNPIDPNYYAMKSALRDQIKAANREMDREAYKEDLKAYPDSGSYDDWLEHNRVDAYVRGLVSPRMNPEWQQPGIYTPQMQHIGQSIRSYLSTP